MSRITLSLSLLVAAGLAGTASATPVTWTNWTTQAPGDPGTATGTLALGSGLTVTYSGQFNGIANDTDWGPASTYAGGGVSNGPASSNNSLHAEGGVSYTETLTFSQAVLNPTMAFWSLGGGYGITAQYNFNNPFTIAATGPSDNLGGNSLYAVNNTLYGNEANGTILFNGAFTSLSFTTPVYEHWWDFTVGAEGLYTAPTGPTGPSDPTGPMSPVPEPGSLALLGTGALGAVGAVRRRLTLRRNA